MTKKEERQLYMSINNECLDIANSIADVAVSISDPSTVSSDDYMEFYQQQVEKTKEMVSSLDAVRRTPGEDEEYIAALNSIGKTQELIRKYIQIELSRREPCMKL